MTQLWNLIVALDQRLFLYINRIWTSPFFDFLFPIYRESTTWIPLYLFILLFVVFNFKKKSLPWILVFIATVGLCDQISSSVLKDLFGRMRPCGDPEFGQYVRLLLSRCPTSGSFTSSHAVNHFGMATFMIVTLKPFVQKTKWALWFWAATIAYGQVYIGVHYPLDVIGGGLVGALIGYTTGKIYLSKFGYLQIAGAVTTEPATRRI